MSVPTMAKTPANAWFIFSTCAVAIFFVWLESTGMPAMVPTFQRVWPEYSSNYIAWILNSYSIVFALLLIPMGWLTDRVGSQRMLTIGLMAYGVTSIACALSPDLPTLIMARITQGAAAACLTPAALAWALQNLPLHQQARAMYLWAAVGGIAAAAGPILANIAHNTAWPWIFFIHVVGSFIALFFIQKLKPSTVDAAKQITTPPQWKTLTQGNFIYLQISTLAFGAAFVFILLNVQQLFIHTFQFSHTQAALHLTLAIAFCVITSFGLAFSRIGKKRKYLTVTGAILTACVGWLFILSEGNAFSIALIIPLLLAGLGLGMALPNFSSLSIHAVPINLKGVANAINQSARLLGSALGIAISQYVQNPESVLGITLTACCLLSIAFLMCTDKNIQ